MFTWLKGIWGGNLILAMNNSTSVDRHNMMALNLKASCGRYLLADVSIRLWSSSELELLENINNTLETNTKQ